MKTIMTNAWKIAKKAAKKFGGKAIEYIGGALKMAWEAAKGLTEKQISSLVSKGYNRWTTDDGERDRLYLNIHKHAGMFHYGKWNGEDIFPACALGLTYASPSAEPCVSLTMTALTPAFLAA